MTSARQLLFALTRQRFSAAYHALVEDLCQRTPVDWVSMARVAASEGVAPIAGVNLASCDPEKTNVPVAVTARLQQALFENVALKAERRREFVEQMRQLTARGYDVLLLKSAGLEAAGVYRHPWVTCARDLDIILKARDVDQHRSDDSGFRQELNESGVENDKNPIEHHDLSINGVVSWPAEDLWRAARPVLLDEPPAAAAYVLSPEDQLWTLCLNSCRKRFFRLKALFDIAETATHYPDLDWDYFARRVHHIHSGRHVTRTALQYASFNGKQRWRSLKVGICGRLPRRTAAELVEAHLPGESDVVRVSQSAARRV
jgi:Uncharacterised nucleotidyltransferase